jgi:MFS family permease
MCMYCRGMELTSSPDPRTAEATRWSRSLWATLVVLCGVVFLDALDVSMVGMALPSIQQDLHLTTGQLQWVVSGYVLGYGGLLLLGGRAADLLGRRRVLLGALSVFVVASALGGLTSDPTLLVVTRFIKGASAAFTAPAAFSIITTTFAEGPARNKALSIFSMVGASGFSLGLVLGGLLTEVGWRWTFLLPAPVALVVVLVAARIVPRDGHLRQSGGYDLRGAVTVSAAMLVLVRAVVTAPDHGWGSFSALTGFVVAVALLIAFVLIELRSPHPLVRLGILRSPALVRANLAALMLFGSYIGFQFIGTLYLQSLLGWSSLKTALAFLPAGVVVALGSTRIAPVINRIGTPRLISAAFLFLATGYALFLRLGAHGSYAGLMLPTMLLLGVGFALGFPSLNVQAASGVPNEEQGLASGLLNTSFQIGGAVGLAIVTAVVTSRTGTSTSTQVALDGFRDGVLVALTVALVGLVIALTGAFSQARAQAPEEVYAGEVSEQAFLGEPA